MSLKTIAKLSLFFFICACSSNVKRSGTNNTGPVKTTPDKTNDTIPHAKETGDSYPELLPADINPADLVHTTLSVGEPFEWSNILQKLFPGSYYQFPDPIPVHDNDSLKLVSWRCGNCVKKQFSGWFNEDPGEFPFKNGNLSRCVDTIQFRDDNGTKNIFLSLATVELTEPDNLHTGRFSGVVMGLAWFVNETNQWKLKAFSPALGCYGAFQSLPEIQLVKLGRNNFGCYLFNGNGGAGGPYYSDVYVFGVLNDQFQVLMSARGVKRYNTGISQWDAAITTKLPAQSFDTIALTISGNYNKTSFTENEDNLDNLPTELKNDVKTKDSFDFEIVRRYYFSNKVYKASKSHTTIR